MSEKIFTSQSIALGQQEGVIRNPGARTTAFEIDITHNQH